MSSSHRKGSADPANVRLSAQGTRVVLVRPAGVPEIAGTITQVRTAPYLRPYVVTCDDGAVVYMSSYQLALEADVQRTPLAPDPNVP